MGSLFALIILFVLHLGKGYVQNEWEVLAEEVLGTDEFIELSPKISPEEYSVDNVEEFIELKPKISPEEYSVDNVEEFIELKTKISPEEYSVDNVEEFIELKPKISPEEYPVDNVEEFIELKPKIPPEEYSLDNMEEEEDAIVEAASEYDDFDSEQELQSEIFIRSMESQFADLLGLFGEELLDRSSRFEDIIRVLEENAVAMTGSLDYKFIEQVLRTLLEWDSAERHKKNKEQLKVLGLTTSDLNGFMSRFFEGVKMLASNGSSRSYKEDAYQIFH